MPSTPNYCKRSGYTSKFTPETLNSIIESIRDEDFSKFFQLIDNTKKPLTDTVFGGRNKVKARTKTMKTRSKKRDSSKTRSKKKRNSYKTRSKKRN